MTVGERGGGTLTSRTVVLILALLSLPLAAPHVSALWSAAGTLEPDTSFDVTHGRMWVGPDTNLTGDHVYFDAFPAEFPTALNPNAGAFGTRLGLTPNVQYQAILGTWKDCNADGYVGLGDNALLAYRATLLLDSTVCPPQQNAEHPHNDGAWVRELVTIGRPDPCVWASPTPSYCTDAAGFHADPGTMDTNGTFVWGDLGLPGDDVQLPSCTLFPLPRGTTSGTGYLLLYADCADDRLALTAFDRADETADPSNAAGLHFEDADTPQSSSSRLNQQLPVTPYGDPRSGHAGLLQQGSGDPAFTAFDCAPGTQPQWDQAQADPQHPTPTRALHVQPRDPTGSYWDAAIALDEAVQGDCDPDTPGSPDALQANDGLVYYEGDAGTPDPRVRSQPDLTFRFQQGSGVHPLVDGTLATTDWPPGGGLVAASGGANGGPFWTSTSWLAARTQLVRSDLDSPIAGARYATFYAHLAHEDVLAHNWTLPPGASTATYGQEACQGATTGVVGGWQCDPTRWWKDAAGASTRPYDEGGKENGAAPLGQVVGAPYELLDVDCEDGRVATTSQGDVDASLAPLSQDGECR